MEDKNVYILTGDAYMISQSLRKLRKTVDNPELNVSEYKAMPKADDLIEACAGYPLLSEKRLVAVRDCTALCASGSAEEAKKIAAYIDKMPETTLLALCSEQPPDKRRSLYKRIAQTGVVQEFPPPTPVMCAAFVSEQAKTQNARISAGTAQQLVSLVGCDYYALENEVKKLAIFSGFGEITEGHLSECVSRSFEYNVFAIHSLLVNKKAAQARALLKDILTDERPEALIGLFARKIRDMYKIKAMKEAGFDAGRIEAQMKMKSYAVKMLTAECARFSAGELREGLKMLADLDVGIKNGSKEPFLALQETLCRIYSL